MRTPHSRSFSFLGCGGISFLGGGWHAQYTVHGAIQDAVLGNVLHARCRAAESRKIHPNSHNTFDLDVKIHRCITVSGTTTMKVRFTTIVEPGVNYNLKQFTREIEVYLSDPNGWISRGYEFEYVTRSPTVVIHLATPAQIHAAGCAQSSLSCAEMNGKHIRLNAARWSGLRPNHSKLSMDDYRQYMVTHEMGHILGHDHVPCPGPGEPAPLMMQQTLGIGACTPNTKLTPSDRR
jgi:hypothetical protein